MSKTEFWDRVETVNAGMLAPEGSARWVPMSHPADRADHRLWFITAKGTDITDRLDAGPAPCAYLLADNAKGLFAQVTGTLSISQDRTSYAEMYYSAAQQLAHHTTCGCPMNVGDLLGSGTISGPTKDSRGSLLELSWGGKEPFAIAGGTRSFIEDHDTLTLRGTCRGDGFTIGFGDCAGTVIPALADPYQRT